MLFAEVTMADQSRVVFPNFFQRPSLKNLKTLCTPPTRLIKQLQLKTHKIFF